MATKTFDPARTGYFVRVHIGWCSAGRFFFAFLTGGDAKVLSLFSGDGVGVLQIEGAIDDSRYVLAELKRFNEMPWVKAVVVRIDSPGGAVAPTQEIFEEIQKIEKEKAVSSLPWAAWPTSGGYYIASACDKIVANPGTLTGSIGVIMQLTNFEELMKKIGVKGSMSKAAPTKTSARRFIPLSPEGREILQSLVDNVHSQFVTAVAKGRGMEEARVRKLADGRVYSGAQAKDLGLIDQFGTLDDAIELAAKRGRHRRRAGGLLFPPGTGTLVGARYSWDVFGRALAWLRARLAAL